MPTDRRYRFMHDNAPPHKARHTQNWLSDFAVRVLPNWPPHSPEFNAIEYIWNWMASFIRAQAPNSRASLKRAARLAWQQLPQTTVRACIDHIPNVCRDVIAAEGGRI